MRVLQHPDGLMWHPHAKSTKSSSSCRIEWHSIVFTLRPQIFSLTMNWWCSHVIWTKASASARVPQYLQRFNFIFSASGIVFAIHRTHPMHFIFFSSLAQTHTPDSKTCLLHGNFLIRINSARIDSNTNRSATVPKSNAHTHDSRVMTGLVYNKIIKAFSLTINAPTWYGAIYTAFDWVSISSLGIQCVCGSNDITSRVSECVQLQLQIVRLVLYCDGGRLSRPLRQHWKTERRIQLKNMYRNRIEQWQSHVNDGTLNTQKFRPDYDSILYAYKYVEIDPNEQDTPIVDYVSNNNKIEMKTMRILEHCSLNLLSIIFSSCLLFTERYDFIFQS